MPSMRLQRVRELLKRTLGEIISRELHSANVGIVTVNDVDISADLHSAVVFVGLMGSNEQKARAVKMLKADRVRIQQILSKTVVLKYTPRLKFVMDDSIERGDRVLQILNELEPADDAGANDSDDTDE